MIMLNKIRVNHCTKWSNAQILNSLFHTKIHADWKESPRPMDFVLKYDRQATAQILDVLNNTSVQELTRYNVTKGRGQKIAKYRETKGPFKSIEQVLEVDDFGAKILEKLVVSIAEGGGNEITKLDKKPLSKILNSITAPALTNEKRSAINTITSICVSRRHLSWAKMETSGRLISWDGWTDFEFPKKDNPMLLHDLALKVRRKLPASDVYVTEAPPALQTATTGQIGGIVANIQCLQLTTMLVTLLATQFDHLNEDDTAGLASMDNCYFLRRQATAVLFHLVVGNETVSSCGVIDHILNRTFTKSLEDIPRITIENPEIDVYDEGDWGKKEALAQALLMSVAFMDLAVKCNPISLKVLEAKRLRKQLSYVSNGQ